MQTNNVYLSFIIVLAGIMAIQVRCWGIENPTIIKGIFDFFKSEPNNRKKKKYTLQFECHLRLSDS